MATAKTDMTTRAAVERWLKRAEERGLSLATKKTYLSRIRHFAEDFPTIPTLIAPIERWLKVRKEGPGKRGDVFRVLQAFYSYLELNESVPNPLPKGKVGRPSKRKLVHQDAQPEPGDELISQDNKLVQGGGVSLSKYTSITTADAVKDFLRSRRTADRSRKTLTRYEYSLNRFAKAFPTVPTTPEDFERFFDGMELSPQSKFSIRKDLIAFYHWLEERNRMPRFLVKIPLVGKERQTRRFLKPEELVDALCGVRTYDEKCLMYTLIDSKCRAGELCSMTAEKLYDNHAIVVGKTGERAVPLSSVTVSILRQLAKSGYLFTWHGKPLTPDMVRNRVKRVLERAGFSGEKLGPHLLRHSAAVKHIMDGGDLATLQAELGHTTPVMTAHYAHLAPQQMIQRHHQVNSMGKLLAQVNSNFAVCQKCGQSTMYVEGDWGKMQCRVCHTVGAWKLPENGNAALATAAPENQGGL